MSKHTPGPWSFDGICYVFGPNMEMIADTETEESHDAVIRMRGVGANLPIEANARLIAAAPELLEACKQFMSGTGYGGCAGEHDRHCHKFFSCYPPADCTCGVALAKAAIAKAEGK